MKYRLFVICVVIAWITTSASCKGVPQEVFIPSGGEGIRSEHDIHGFDELEISGFFKVEVIQGAQFQVMTETALSLVEALQRVTEFGATLSVLMSMARLLLATNTRVCPYRTRRVTS